MSGSHPARALDQHEVGMATGVLDAVVGVLNITTCSKLPGWARPSIQSLYPLWGRLARKLQEAQGYYSD